MPVTPPLATSITRSVRSVTANTRLPSVLRMSGSSTPISCVLVPEKSSVVPPISVLPETGSAAVGAGAEPSLSRCGAIGGVTTASISTGAARGTTPGPPSVRSAPARA